MSEPDKKNPALTLLDIILDFGVAPEMINRPLVDEMAMYCDEPVDENEPNAMLVGNSEGKISLIPIRRYRKRPTSPS
ncbi:MAG TPA: hypothetical protein VJS44_04670 [Pyrinomonadaceae bacterium]|nr:hypothetical protein [Pyrinomonadaceae bacterium]